MLANYLSALATLGVLLGVWITVQTLARRVAAHHPEAGPFREAGAGCGGGCGGCAKTCSSKPDPSTTPRPIPVANHSKAS